MVALTHARIPDKEDRVLGSRTERIQKLRRRVADGGKRRSKNLVGNRLAESGLLDRAVLNQQIEAILQEAAGQEAAGNTSAADQVEPALEALIGCAKRGEIPEAAKHVTAILSLEMDDLRRAALLSLMVRLVGRRRFDPVAAYVLEKSST